jgi:hypothetical protein
LVDEIHEAQQTALISRPHKSVNVKTRSSTIVTDAEADFKTEISEADAKIEEDKSGARRRQHEHAWRWYADDLVETLAAVESADSTGELFAKTRWILDSG